MTAALFDLPEPTDLPEPIDPTGSVAAGSGSAASPAAEVTFLHTADWQIGMTRHFLGPDAAHAYADARQDAIAEIGRLAADVGARFVLVCGDVFEDPRVGSKVIRRTLDRLADYPVPVYLLPGNHDPADPAGIYRSRTFLDACPDNVVVLSVAGVIDVGEGVELVAAPWDHKRPLVDLVGAQLDRLDPSESIRIVAGHGGVDALVPSGDPAVMSVQRLESAVEDGLVDYVALGDRHSRTQVGETGRIWYSGAHEVTDFDHVESDPGHVLQVGLRRGAEPSVISHRVGQWRFHSLIVDVNGAEDIEILRRDLEAIADKTRVVLKLGLVGSISVSQDAALQEMLAGFEERFAALVRWTSKDDLAVVGDTADVESLGLTGYAAEAATELLETASSESSDAETARDALALLHRLAGRNR